MGAHGKLLNVAEAVINSKYNLSPCAHSSKRLSTELLKLVSCRQRAVKFQVKI